MEGYAYLRADNIAILHACTRLSVPRDLSIMPYRDCEINTRHTCCLNRRPSCLSEPENHVRGPSAISLVMYIHCALQMSSINVTDIVALLCTSIIWESIEMVLIPKVRPSHPFKCARVGCNRHADRDYPYLCTRSSQALHDIRGRTSGGRMSRASMSVLVAAVWS